MYSIAHVFSSALFIVHVSVSRGSVNISAQHWTSLTFPSELLSGSTHVTDEHEM